LKTNIYSREVIYAHCDTLTNKQTQAHTSRQTNQHTHIQADKQTITHTYKQTNKQTHAHTSRQGRIQGGSWGNCSSSHQKKLNYFIQGRNPRTPYFCRFVCVSTSSLFFSSPHKHFLYPPLQADKLTNTRTYKQKYAMHEHCRIILVAIPPTNMWRS